MGIGDDNRKLHALVEDSRIRQRTHSDPIPPAHETTFTTIRDLGRITFKDYSNNGAKTLSNEPWKRDNANRARWLVKKANELSANSANESTWRMHIENTILQPFSIEVAWSVCIMCRPIRG